MSVELKVVLVGEDQEQQSAFNNPAPVASASPSIPPVQSATTPVAPPVQPSTQPTGGTQSEPIAPPIQQPTTAASSPASVLNGASNSASSPVPPPVQGQEQKLIDSIDQLIESIDALTGANTNQRNPRNQPASQPGQANQPSGNLFEKFSATIDRKIEDLGLKHTSVGNMVANLTNMVAGAGARVTKATTSFVEPVVNGAAGLVGRGAATGAAEVAGGAAAGAEATTGVAAAAGAVALPLVAVAAAAAASVLSLKAFMAAVDRAAGELEDLSPQVAAVRAQQEVTLELARLDRAKRIGGDVAGLEAARNRINESMYEVQTKIYELVLKGTPVLERVLDALNMLIRTVDFGIASVGSGIATLTINDPTDDKPAQQALAKSVVELAQAMNEFNETQNNQNFGRDPMFDELLGFQPANKGKAPNKGNGLGGGP